MTLARQPFVYAAVTFNRTAAAALTARQSASRNFHRFSLGGADCQRSLRRATEHGGGFLRVDLRTGRPRLDRAVSVRVRFLVPLAPGRPRARRELNSLEPNTSLSLVSYTDIDLPAISSLGGMPWPRVEARVDTEPA